MLKHSLAAAAIFSAVAANAAEPVVVPHYTMNTSQKATSGTVTVTPRGYVVASMADAVPEVSSCAKNTDEVLNASEMMTGMLDVVFLTGSANSSEAQTIIHDLNIFAGGMRFSFEQCQKSTQPVTGDKAQRVGSALDALQSSINSLRKPAL